jgi:hypothetical protein
MTAPDDILSLAAHEAGRVLARLGVVWSLWGGLK